MKINSETLKLLGKELPWVLDLIPEGAEEFQVKLMDLDTLNVRPSGETWIHRLFERLYLIDQSGRVICRVGVEEKPVQRCAFTWRPPFLCRYEELKTVFSSETVEAAIKRIGEETWKTRYIVYIHMRGVHIYKLPKRIESLRVWLDQKATEASLELRKTLEVEEGALVS